MGQVIPVCGECAERESDARIILAAVFFYVCEPIAVSVYVESAAARGGVGRRRRRVSRAEGGDGLGARVYERDDWRAVNLARPDGGVPNVPLDDAERRKLRDDEESAPVILREYPDVPQYAGVVDGFLTETRPFGSRIRRSRPLVPGEAL